jgi:tetratricopeptide (TPR) repeat protein
LHLLVLLCMPSAVLAQKAPENWSEQFFSALTKPAQKKEVKTQEKTGIKSEAPEEILKRNPKDEQALLALARQCTARGDIKQALKYYLTLQEIDPGNPANTELGKLLGQAGNQAASIGLLRAFLKVTPNNPSLKRDLAFALSQSKKSWTEAVGYLRDVLQFNPQDNEARLLLARLLNWGQFNSTEAAEQYKKYLDRSPKNDSVRLELADLLSRNPSDRPQALALMNEILQRDPGNLKARLAKGQLYTWMGRWGDAVNDLSAIEKENPSDLDCTLLLARALNWGHGNTKRATELYRKYLDKKPNDIPVHLELAELLSHQAGTRSLALSQVNLVLQKDAANSRARLLRAQLYTWMGRWSESLEDLHWLAGREPSMTVDGTCNGHARKISLLLYLGHVEWWSGRAEEAIQSYIRYLSASPFDSDVRAEYAAVLFDRKRWKEAADQYQIIVNAQPENLDARLHHALALNELDRKDESIAELSKVAETNPMFPAFDEKIDGHMRKIPVAVALSGICAMSGDPSAATKSYVRCLSTLSDHDVALVLDGSCDLLNNPALSQQDFDSLAAAIEKRYPSNLKPLMARAVREQNAGNFAGAIALLRDFERKNAGGEVEAPMDIEGLRRSRPVAVALGLLYYWVGDKEQAAECLSAYAQSHPDDWGVRLLFGRVLSYLPGKEKMAHGILDSVLQEPALPVDKIAEAKIAMALCFTAEHDDDRALEQVSQALSQPDLSHSVFIEALFMKANMLASTGRGTEGEKLLIEYLATPRGEHDVPTRLLLARIMTYGEEHRKQGMDIMRELLGLDASNEELLADLPESMIWSEQYGEAISFLQVAIQKKPDSRTLRLLLAQAYRKADKHAEACAVLREMLVRFPGDTTALIALARELYQLDKFNEAKELLNAAIAKDPGNGSQHLALAEILAQRDPQVAIQHVDIGASVAPHKDALEFAEDWVWHSDTRPLAREICSALKKRNPQDDGALLILGTADALTAGHKVAGLETVEQYVKAHPRDIGAKIRLANLLSWDGRSRRAQEMYQQVLRERPNDARLILGLAGAEGHYPKTYAQALNRLSEYTARFPDDVTAKRLMAEVHVYSGNEKIALKSMQELMAKYPNDLSLIAEDAQFQSWTSHLDKAMREFRYVLSKDPNNKSALVGLAEVLSWTGYTLEAEKLLAKARALYPHDESVELATSRNFRMIGRYDKAMHHLEEAHFD